MAQYPEPKATTTTFMALDSVPLFMRNIPDEDPAGNIAFEALQSLVYEGTPDEQAKSFKEQGNDYFRGKRFREAVAFYTQGINVDPQEPQLREALLLNRAACNLELRNFGSVLRDTSAALLINPRAPKGYFRASAALVGLDRYVEALDVCDRCLAFDPNNVSVRGQRDKVIALKQAWENKEMEKAERQRKEKEAQRVMNAAFQALHLIVIPTNRQLQYEPHFDPSFSGLRTSATPVMFPVFLLYPMTNQSDLITSFDPSSTFSSHLATMFPPTPGAPPIQTAYGVEPPATGPDWDTTGEYTTSNLAIYAATARRRILKVGKRMTLRDACDASAVHPKGEKDGLELRDGALSFYVLPKGNKEAMWVDEWKKKWSAEGI